MFLVQAKLIANPIIEMSVHSGKLFGTHLGSDEQLYNHK
jgi:hypothetical protein